MQNPESYFKPDNHPRRIGFGVVLIFRLMIRQLRYILLFFLLASCFQYVSGQGVNNYGHTNNDLLFMGDVYGDYTYFFSYDSISPITDTALLIYPNPSNFYNFRYAVYSDKNGKLKLYSDGKYVWNGNHQKIDSNNLMPKSTHDLNVAVPMPGNPDLVYVFTLVGSPNHPDTLYYSLIDLSGNNGLGSVAMYGQEFAPYGLAGGLALTKHANGRDYWLVSKKEMTNQYLAFHIKPGGAVDTVFSQAGITPSYGNYMQYGILKFSPDGKWLGDNILKNALVNDTLQLLNFNAASGIITDTNARYVPAYYPFDAIGLPYRYAFSANSKFIYVNQWDNYQTRFCQYEMTSADQQAFFNSRVLVRNYVFPNGANNQGDLHLAANGKIYNPSSDNAYGLFFNSIENPDMQGASCNWQDHSYTFNNTISYTEYSQFPIFCSSWLLPPVDFSYTHTCAGENAQPTLFAFTDSVYKAEWHFGDSLAGGADTSSSLYPSYNYMQPGQYTVWAKALHYGMWDSIAKTIIIHQNPQIDIGIDTTLTGYDTLVLDPGSGYASYLWNTGDTTQTLTLYGVQMSGGSHTYWVEVTDTNGCSAKAYRTITYSGVGINEHKQQAWKVFPNPANEQLTIELPKALQEEAVLKLYNQSGALVRRYEWPGQDKTHRLSLKGLSNGIYWLELDTEQRKYRQKVMKR